jgi:hypothetical protein
MLFGWWPKMKSSWYVAINGSMYWLALVGMGTSHDYTCTAAILQLCCCRTAAAGARGRGGAGMRSGNGGPTHAWPCPAAS